MGKTGLSHDIFFKFSVGPFEVIEVEWPQMIKFWGCDLKIFANIPESLAPHLEKVR